MSDLFRLMHPDEVVTNDGFTFLWECQDCGAMVKQTDRHERFHERMKWLARAGVAA